MPIAIAHVRAFSKYGSCYQEQSSLTPIAGWPRLVHHELLHVEINHGQCFCGVGAASIQWENHGRHSMVRV
eukprot:1150813-Pelagomonas_calceolata.AAC.4